MIVIQLLNLLIMMVLKSLMTLDPAGYVGIAHTAPEAALHVSGNFLVGSSLIDSATNLIVTDNKVGIGTYYASRIA